MDASIETVPIHVDTSRKIIHVDMDAFYASIEERENPKLRELPLVIAKDPRQTGGKGVVATANYLARQSGVHSAMSAQKALELCPKAFFKTPNFTLYRQVSDQIHDIFHEYTEKIEPVAFDEAYLDVTQNKKKIESAVEVAHRIQSEIFAKTQLTCSTGISYNKFLAKLASEYQKPVGVAVVLPEDVREFLDQLPIEKFRGVGAKTIPKMHDLKIFSGHDLYLKSELELIHHFGRFGDVLFHHVRGSDDRAVEYQRERKSIGKESTYNPNLVSEDELIQALKELAQKVSTTMAQKQKHGKTLVLKVRYADFETITKRQTFTEYLDNSEETYLFYARQIFDEFGDIQRGIRLLGITMTNLAGVNFQNLTLPLFNEK
ncbi:DNA polymerase IV [Pediococcus cellicola]|uniref:DNA polymerase IV n=1 Tax=Pediococcus cellicola TaxID=319652 RepID=A0A0R2IKG3_9LACO|nr:DNA polymerase IV [Pediococcus cellicola]KRN65118.1 DNA-directed DNA polymerase IV [Pediococcus cellicola]GEL15835.1 DNA polymerase IV [Pediococcus cellicola]